MSFGHAACHAYCVEQSFVEKHCSKEWENFISVLDKEDMCIEFFVIEHKGEDISSLEDSKDKLVKVFVKLVKAFKKNTGLDLYLDYHDEDERDRDDDVTGLLFCIDNAVQLTPEAEKFKSHIKQMNWFVGG